VPFAITVRACDASWNLVTSVTNVIGILSTDGSATLPPDAALASGSRSFTVTLNAAGSFTVFAHDQSDNTIPDGASAPVTTIVLQSFAFSSISQKNQNAGQPMSITITARGPGGVLVSGYDGPVRLREITSLGEGRIAPDSVNLSSGSWTGAVTMYRADETSINRGNVNLLAYLSSSPSTNGSSDPFTVHPGPFARLQLLVPGETALPGSVAGRTGSPVTQTASRAFTASVQATDNWWNPLASGDNVRVTSSDGAANTPLTSVLTNGFRAFSVILGTVGSQTLTASDLTNGTITGMTTAGINVVPAGLDHFVVAGIASPQTAGVAVAVTIHAVDSNGNTVPNFNGDALLLANTGAGSMTPEVVTFASGAWSGGLTFRGAGAGVAFTCSDYSVPPHTGASNTFTVSAGALDRLQVLLPGESARGGTANGKSGTPNGQQAGTAFTVTVLATDRFWNVVPGTGDSVALSSSDGFGVFPAHIALANGQALVSATLYSTGPADVRRERPHAVFGHGRRVGRHHRHGRAVRETADPGAGEFPGARDRERPRRHRHRRVDQLRVQCHGARHRQLVEPGGWRHRHGAHHIGRSARHAAAQPGAGGRRAEMPVTLARGGYDLISVSGREPPPIPGASTQVRAISSGFHLEATVTPASAARARPSRSPCAS
jgi:hypothetical protein